jgi:hypothetical protein
MTTSTTILSWLGAAALCAAAAAPGCSVDSDPSFSGASSGASTSGGGEGSTTATTGAGGAGGSGATTTTTAATTTTTTTAATTTTGAGGGPPLPDHLVISEIAVQPAEAEFVEIWNPTDATVDLTDYYLSDNSTYTSIAAGKPWQPITDNPGTDFLVRFPAGTTLGPDQVLTIATNIAYFTTWSTCPTFLIAQVSNTCNGAPLPAMDEPEGGDLGTVPGTMFSNAREMLVLFTWDGDTSHTLKDVDYVTWGDAFDDASRADKTAVQGYLPDTPRAEQKPAPIPGPGSTIERCESGGESGEPASGGNGITGHDETGEDLTASFNVASLPSPGAKNACLP